MNTANLHVTLYHVIIYSMKKASITIFSSLILVVFISTIVFFGLSIKKEIDSSDKRNNETFNTKVRAVENNLNHLAELDFSTGSDSISSVSIRHNNELITCYPNEEIAENASSTNLLKIFNKTIVIDEDVYSIKASLYLLRPSVIYSTTKKAFIIILGATLLTIIILIYTSKTDYGTSDYQDEETEEFSDDEILQENDENVLTEDNPEADKSFDNEEKESDDTSEDSVEEDTDVSENFNNDKVYDFNPVTETENVTDSVEEKPYFGGLPEVEAKVSVEKEAFMEKLNSAISKTASEENDLSLYLFEVNNPANDEKIRHTLTEYFSENNIEKIDTNIFAAFKENQVIDDAEDYASQVQSKVSTYSSDNNCFVGISSKSIRMLSAERLMMEAEEALCHSKDDPSSPIIGFHVDIEKYREFIKNS